MSDLEMAHDILINIMTAMGRLERRFSTINTPDDFVVDDDGLDRLDGIAMMLIAIGEQLKRLDLVLDIDLDYVYPRIDWKGAKGIRDILSHHYFNIDAEIIFDVCENKVGDLKEALLDIQKNVNQALNIKLYKL